MAPVTKSFVAAAPVGDAVPRLVRVTLSRGVTFINPVKEEWEVVERLAKVFRYTVSREGHSFTDACEESFQLALMACRAKQWALLSPGDVKDDLTRLAVYVRDSIANYAIAQRESWISDLIEKRIDIHSVDVEGNTPLHIAARTGAAHLVTPLCAQLDLYATNLAGQTPLELAILFGQSKVVLELIKRGVSTDRRILVGESDKFSLDAVGFAVMRGEAECVECLIVNGRCRLEDNYSRIGNLLHVAIHFNQYAALKLLLEVHKEKTDVLIERRNETGLTPLSMAASLGELEPIEILTEAGASLECRDPEGKRPMHYAALGFHYDAIQLLAAKGAKIKPADDRGNRPIDLLKGREGTFEESCRALLGSLMADKALRGRFPAAQFHPPKNLVFRGGGPKGLAFLGSLLHMQDRGYLPEVRRVAGTSAGAITAALISTGFPVGRLPELLMTKNFMDFLDHPFAAATIADASKGAGPLSQAVKVLDGILKIVGNPLGSALSLVQKLYRCTGVCEGEAFRFWIEEQIKRASGLDYLTFGELAKLVEGDPKKYKHLHVYATKVGASPQIVHLSSEDPALKDIIISDAVRASMSIPGVFKPHTIHVLSCAAGRRDRIPYLGFGSFLDGGMLYNFPVETFDQKQYLTQEPLEAEGRCPKFNKETIGFSLWSSCAEPAGSSSPVRNVLDLLKGICRVYLGAEEAIRALNPYNRTRVIEIDVKDVGTLDFNMSDDKKRELIASGREAIGAFIAARSSGEEPAPIEKSAQEELAEKVEARRFALHIKRTENPAAYPAYYDHLLDKGYIHLYDHLLKMKELKTRGEREEKIKTLSFCDVSHVILETRRVLIDSVTIPADKPSLFLLGSTGSGKSTTFCFLRGDEMRLDGGGLYSSTHPGESLIGHGTRSCTFLPTVAKSKDQNVIIVDYPGFDDSNGPLVALGMECALKDLIHKYQPRILVLDAITNVEGKYVAQTRMGNLLRRLLGSTEHCVVGLTKYSKQPDWIKLRTIETRQREELSAPSAEEIKLEAKIQAWKELDDPALQLKIEAEEKKLAQVIRSREGVPLTDLPDTLEKKECRKRLEEQEQELLRQLGLTEKLRLVDLEDPRGKSQILRAISEFRRATNPVVQQTLDAEHERFLKERFEETVIPLIETRSFEEVNISELERITLESSLINALLFSSHPEIAEFLHLPEIDPSVAQFFSRRVVKKCIDKLIHQAFEKIDLTLINKILDEFVREASPTKLKGLKEKTTRFSNYVLGLVGERAETSKQSEEKWNKIREEKLAVEKKVDGKYELSLLSKIGYGLLLGIPLWLNNKRRYEERASEVRRTLDDHCDVYSKALDEAYATLNKLKGLEKVVEKKVEIDRALGASSLSFDSLDSLGDSIEGVVGEVKKHYSAEEWERRVAFLRGKISEVFDRRGKPLPLLDERAEKIAAPAALLASTFTAALEEGAAAGTGAGVYSAAAGGAGATAAGIVAAGIVAAAIVEAATVGLYSAAAIVAAALPDRAAEFEIGAGVPNDLALTLFLGQDPSFEVIKISGGIPDIARLCLMSQVLHGDVLLFKYKEMTVILKKYRNEEERFLRRINARLASFKGISRIEILSGETKVVGQRSGTDISFSSEKGLEEEVAQFEKDVGITLVHPLVQMLVRDALRPHLMLGNGCFWMRGLYEIPISKALKEPSKEPSVDYILVRS